jgi:hypothetical protein
LQAPDEACIHEGACREKALFFLQILGIVMVAAGMAGLTWCIYRGYRLARAGLPPNQMRARLQQLVPVNLASVCIAGLGLAVLLVSFLL